MTARMTELPVLGTRLYRTCWTVAFLHLRLDQTLSCGPGRPTESTNTGPYKCGPGRSTDTIQTLSQISVLQGGLQTCIQTLRHSNCVPGRSRDKIIQTWSHILRSGEEY